MPYQPITLLLEVDLVYLSLILPEVKDVDAPVLTTAEEVNAIAAPDDLLDAEVVPLEWVCYFDVVVAVPDADGLVLASGDDDVVVWVPIEGGDFLAVALHLLELLQALGGSDVYGFV